MSITGWMKRVWGKGTAQAAATVAAIPPVSSDSTISKDVQDNPYAYSGMSSTSAKMFLAYLDVVNATRFRRYTEYKALEQRHSLIGRALNMFADYTIHGGEVRDGSTFEVELADEKLQAIVDEGITRIGLKKAAWPIVRALCQYGDHFEELVAGPSGLIRMKAAPRTQMVRVEDQWGILKGYAQVVAGTSSSNANIELDPWQMVHWRLVVDREEKYGQSELYGALRAGRESGLVEDSSTIGRLTRGTQKYKWKIWMKKGLSLKEQNEIIAEHKKNNARSLAMNADGSISSISNPLRTNEDLYVACLDDVDPKNQPDVSILPSDKGVGSIADIIHKQERMFMALPFPLSWYGLTGARTRADADQAALNAIRAVRRIREAFSEGVLHIVRVILISAGVPWDQADAALADAKVVFPTISHADTLMKLAIDKLRLQVATMLRAVGLMSREDVLVQILEYPEDEAIKLLQRAIADPAAFGPNMSGLMDKGGAPDAEPTESLVDAVRDIIESKNSLLDMAEDIRETLADVESLRRAA